MTKLLRFAALLVAVPAVAQMQQVPVSGDLASFKVSANARVESELPGPFLNNAEKAEVSPSFNYRESNCTLIGNTQYDGQSNASMPRRIVHDEFGTAAVWIQSLQVTPFNDRGTGFNHKEAGSDEWDDAPFDRIEAIRTGWPTLVRTGSGRDVVICHEFPVQGYMAYRDQGETDWTEGYLETTVEQGVGWLRATNGGSDGNSIHLLALTMTPENQTADPPLLHEGMETALVYSRSLDQGETWDIQEVVLDGMGAEDFIAFRPDAYAMHANGDKVAIAVFNAFADSFVMISEDNGDTWTKRILFDFPVDLYTGDDELIDLDEDGVADIVESTDGCGAVLVDSNDRVHVAWGHMNYQDDVLGDDDFSYFPFTDGLAYWNDSMEDNSWEDVAFALDLDGDGEVFVAEEFVRYGLSGLTCMPQFAEGGELYLIYCSAAETHATGSQTYKHIYLTKFDGGSNGSWSPPCDRTPDQEYIGYEYVYPSADPVVTDGLVRLIFQQDFEPGTHAFGDGDPVDLNDIVYMETDYDGCISSIPELAMDLEVYPNPVMDNLNISSNGVLEAFSISDMLGQRILEGKDTDGLIDVRSLSPGSYVLTVETAAGRGQQTFIKY